MEKLKTNFIVINLKKYIVSIISVGFIITLVLFSTTNLQAAKAGLKLWANSVVPSLFPFFVATEILCNTNLVYVAGKYLRKPIQKIFNVPGEGAIAIIMGIISGYPTGAKIVVNFREKNICSKEEGERLLAFTNNSGPLFILGTVGISLFGDVKIGYLLLISHIISSLIVGIIFKNWKKGKLKSYTDLVEKVEKPKNIGIRDLGDILGIAIKKTIITILNIGGFIVIFSVILSILENSGFFSIIENICKIFGISSGIGTSLISGIIELTNGVSKLSLLGNKNIYIILASFLLGFGGISVLLQVYSVISKSDISIKPYFYGKVIQACLSGLVTFLLLSL